jgi:hypothetical protein
VYPESFPQRRWFEHYATLFDNDDSGYAATNAQWLANRLRH